MGYDCGEIVWVCLAINAFGLARLIIDVVAGFVVVGPRLLLIRVDVACVAHAIEGKGTFIGQPDVDFQTEG